jgi:hypothetical protein
MAAPTAPLGDVRPSVSRRGGPQSQSVRHDPDEGNGENRPDSETDPRLRLDPQARHCERPDGRTAHANSALISRAPCHRRYSA